MCSSWSGRFKLAEKLDGDSWKQVFPFCYLSTPPGPRIHKKTNSQKYSLIHKNILKHVKKSVGSILRTSPKVEQSGSRFTALFFWDRIYLWQYLSISCAFAIYGSYITAKMGLLVPADFYHVKEKNYYRKLPLVLCSIVLRHKVQINHCCKLYKWEKKWFSRKKLLKILTWDKEIRYKEKKLPHGIVTIAYSIGLEPLI